MPGYFADVHEVFEAGDAFKFDLEINRNRRL